MFSSHRDNFRESDKGSNKSRASSSEYVLTVVCN